MHQHFQCEQLAASGERERLKTLLRERLVECGWKEDVTRHARGADNKCCSMLMQLLPYTWHVLCFLSEVFASANKPQV